MAEKQAINEYRWHTHGNGVWHKKEAERVVTKELTNIEQCGSLFIDGKFGEPCQV